MKAALLAPLALLAICTLGLVSGVLAAPMHVHPVAVSRGESPTASTETATEGEVRTMVRFERTRRAIAAARVWTCGATEASAVGGSYRRCDWQVSK